MNALTEEWPAARVFHLTGGARATNLTSPEVSFEPFLVSGQPFKFTGRDFRSIPAEIQALGFKIIGVDHYTSRMELDGQFPPDWRILMPNWLAWEQGQVWSRIANAAYGTKNGHAWDLAARISHQFRVCDWRVRQICGAYAEQLLARVKQGDAKDGLRFEDGFTELAYIAIQSYLIDACILRDYVAEFIANVIWTIHGVENERPSTTMGSLIRRVLPRIPRPNQLASLVESSTSGDGWLKKLGAYRDLVVHAAPLKMAGGRLVGLIEERSLPSGQSMAILRLPVPVNPLELITERSSQQLFADFSEHVKALINSVLGKTAWVDALDYVASVHHQLSDFASKVAAESPVKGTIITITDADIFGEIRIKH